MPKVTIEADVDNPNLITLDFTPIEAVFSQIKAPIGYQDTVLDENGLEIPNPVSIPQAIVLLGIKMINEFFENAQVIHIKSVSAQTEEAAIAAVKSNPLLTTEMI